MSTKDDLRVAIGGNMYFEHPISVHKGDGFLKTVDILRNADAAVGNLECAIGAEDHWPSFAGGMGWSGTHMTAPPLMLEELRFLGIDAVFAANNHTADFAEGGLLATIDHLKSSGLAYAGIGANLTEAARATYVETARGRVAVISASDWGPRRLMELPFPWPNGFLPSDEPPPFVSRPGVNLLRYDVVVHVDDEAFEQLRRISAMLQWEKGKIVRRSGGARTETLLGTTLIDYEIDTDDEFFFMGRKFVRDSEFAISTFAYQEDLDRIFRSVRDARLQADVVIVGLHDQSHANGVPDFVETLAHGCIDAGADIYVNHGGRPRGIEIYKGKPLLYGQPTFHLQNDQSSQIPREMLTRMGIPKDGGALEFVEARHENEARALAAGGQSPHGPADAQYIQVVVFDDGGRPTAVEIHPIFEPTLGSHGRKGVPEAIEPGTDRYDVARQDAIDRCKPFGTVVEDHDGIFVVSIPS